VICTGAEVGGSAARLLGAARTWRETFEVRRYVFCEADHQQTLRAAQRQLSPKTWSVQHGVGRALTPDQAMSEAERQLQDLVAVWTGRETGLTDRELEVLQAVTLGLSNAEIAAQLVVSTRTVHAHLRSIFEKLHVPTRTAATHEAVRLNLV